MSKTTKRIPGIGGVVLTLIVAGGCDSLVISNPNAPDTPHLLANPASVLTVAQGAMKTWYLTTQGGLGEDQYPARRYRRLQACKRPTLHWYIRYRTEC